MPTTAKTTNYKAYAGRTPVSTTTGGYAHYLAGHKYDDNSLGNINGRRIYMNAFLRSATRPSNCGLNMGPVAVNDEGTLTPCGQNSVTINVLSNDSNPMGGSLTLNLLGNGSHGTFVNNNNGRSLTPPTMAIGPNGCRKLPGLCWCGL
ncbi:MAG: Ig-like domain-containing protein [Saprospiraceae bacterium]